MRRAILLVTVMVTAMLLAYGGVALAQPGAPGSSQSSQSEKHAPDRVIVKLKEGASSGALEESNRGIGASTERQIAPHILPTLYTVKLPQGLSVEKAIEHYKAARDIEYAEPDFFVYHDQTTINDPYYTDGSLWGLNNTTTPAADIDAPGAWNAMPSSAQETVVGVIDEGADLNHPDLKANIWTNPGESGTDAQGRDKATNGVDDDGNGYVDDVHGWDFYNKDNTTYDGNSSGSVDAHGTHVSGTIGAVGNNSTGVIGVNYSKVKIITAKFLGPNGGYTSDAISAVDYITDLKKNRGINVKITNNSWGGGGYSQGLLDAINRADTAGILFVAAAGNDGANTDSSPHYPSSYTANNIISVAATDNTDGIASWSNYGTTSVDLGAPGVGIYSTVPNSSYSSYSGTSMATPHVSGSAALLMSSDPNLTHSQVKDKLLQNVDQISSLSGKTLTGGRLNVAKALGGGTSSPPPTSSVPPDTPSGLTATANGSKVKPQISLTWSNVANETGYTVERCTGSSSTCNATSASWKPVGSVSADITSYTDTYRNGLVKGTTYTYRVYATNSAGNSNYSNYASATTRS